MALTSVINERLYISKPLVLGYGKYPFPAVYIKCSNGKSAKLNTKVPTWALAVRPLIVKVIKEHTHPFLKKYER